MNRKYITVEEFSDFGVNQEKMIEVLNHSMTKLADAVVDIKEKLSELIGGFKVVKKIVWWILGIIAFVVGITFISSLGSV